MAYAAKHDRRRRAPPRLALALLCSALGACGLGDASPAGSRTVGIRRELEARTVDEARAPMNQAELQQRLERVVVEFTSEVNEAGAALDRALSGARRTTAWRQLLLYNSSALDIATGPEPEVNLLDLVVFAELAGERVKSHFIPEVFGEKGRPLLRAFERLLASSWAIAGEVLTDAQANQLRWLIADFRARNEERIRVEDVRLEAFATAVGDAAATRAARSRGLLASVKTGIQKADQGLLLAERGLFLGQRVPFLVRAHARLAFADLAGDVERLVGELEVTSADLADLRPLLEETAALLARAEATTREARALGDEMGPLLERSAAMVEDGKAERLLVLADRLSARTLAILTELRAMTPESDDPLAAVGDRADALLRRAMIYAALAGAFVSIVFWAGFVVAKRVAARPR